MIKKFLTGVALCALSTAAMAADIGTRKVAPVAPAIATSWSGAYVSGSLGASLAKFNMDDKDCWYCASGTFTNGNIEFGARAGYDFQDGPLVYGVSLGVESGNRVAENVWWDDARLRFSVTSVIGLRGRVGYAFGSSLIYASAGYLYAKTNATLDYNNGNQGANPTDQAKLKSGLNGVGLGLGFARQITGTNITVGVEAEQQMFQTRYANMYDLDNQEPSQGFIGFGLNRTVVRGNISYRF